VGAVDRDGCAVRTSEDVLRSFKRYVALLVIPDFEVRLSSEEGAWERPFCRVAWTTPITNVAHGARAVECRRTMQIVAWPAESEKPDDAVLVAERLNEQFTQAFSVGLHAASYNRGTGRAHPLRVPIYDYADVPAEEPVTEDDRAATDFASIVEQPTVGDIPDPNTDLSRLVIADLRVRWMRSTAIPTDGETIEQVVVGAPAQVTP
jgi:hypothetical protein